MKGLYVVRVQDTERQWLQVSKLVAVTDIGLIVKQGATGGTTVFANSIRTAAAAERRHGEPGELEQPGDWHRDHRRRRRGAVRLGGQHEALPAGHGDGGEGGRFFLPRPHQKPGRNLAL